MRTETVIIRLLKWRWWIASLFIVGLTTLEFLEHTTWGLNFFDDSEFFIYILTLLIAALLFELLARSNRRLDAALKTLDYKHKFSIELSEEADWDTLTTRLVQFPQVITDAVASVLILCDPYCRTNELIARWGKDNLASGTGLDEERCASCLELKTSRLHLFKSCQNTLLKEEMPNQDVYCLPIHDSHATMAVLRFKMAAGKKPAPEQVSILDNVIDEMAISLKTSQERKIQAEMRVAEANLIQRKDIWRYLHDHLGQNLAYLRLKLDQFSKPTYHPPLTEIHTDLEHMRDVANDSYLMVRNWLESRHPDTQSQMADLLMGHAREMAKRENFEIAISCEGTPLQIESSAQQKIFYIFREAMNNIARHAEASKVELGLAWGPSDLTLTVSDNGKGFDPNEIDGSTHFGFKIMNERVAELNGCLDFDTSLQVGTVVRVWIPVQ